MSYFPFNEAVAGIYRDSGRVRVVSVWPVVVVAVNVPVLIIVAVLVVILVILVVLV